jgi:hypothetical protein
VARRLSAKGKGECLLESDGWVVGVLFWDVQGLSFVGAELRRWDASITILIIN